MKKRTVLVLMLLLLSTAACVTSPPQISPEDQLATIVAQTLTALPLLSVVPTQTPASPPTATPFDTPSGPYYTFTSAQNVNLRTQPGTLFPVSRVMAQGTRLQVLGLAPGGEWIFVLNDEGVGGWVDRTFVADIPEGRFDLVEPQDCQLVKGYVVDTNADPISGIGFAVEQAGKRTDAATDTNGVFFAYLPLSASGVWRVSYISIATTSNIVHWSCLNQGICGSPQPSSIDIALPANEVLAFGWLEP